MLWQELGQRAVFPASYHLSVMEGSLKIALRALVVKAIAGLSPLWLEL